MATVELGRMAEEEAGRQAAVILAALAAEVAPLVSMVVAVVVMVALAAEVGCLVAKAESSAAMPAIALPTTIVQVVVVAH
jgi:hypothetical protein